MEPTEYVEDLAAQSMAVELPLEFLVAVHALRYNTRVDDVSREVAMEVANWGTVALRGGVDNSRIYSQRSGLCCDEKISSS